MAVHGGKVARRGLDDMYGADACADAVFAAAVAVNNKMAHVILLKIIGAVLGHRVLLS